MSHAREPGPVAGFTLIEVLIALAMVTVVLASIGAVIATTVRGTRSIEQRLAMAGAAATLYASLPTRGVLAPGRQSGEISGYRWQMDVVPLAGIPVEPPGEIGWMPLRVRLQLQARTGAAMQFDTIRLVRRTGG